MNFKFRCLFLSSFLLVSCAIANPDSFSPQVPESSSSSSTPPTNYATTIEIEPNSQMVTEMHQSSEDGNDVFEYEVNLWVPSDISPQQRDTYSFLTLGYCLIPEEFPEQIADALIPGDVVRLIVTGGRLLTLTVCPCRLELEEGATYSDFEVDPAPIIEVDVVDGGISSDRGDVDFSFIQIPSYALNEEGALKKAAEMFE